MGRFCGSGRITDAVVSTGSRMLVTYVTSQKQNGHRGFSASYEGKIFIKQPFETLAKSLMDLYFCYFYPALCGGELDLDAGGHLESPNYPEDYQPSKECVWRLTVPEDYQVSSNFRPKFIPILPQY